MEKTESDIDKFIEKEAIAVESLGASIAESPLLIKLVSQ